MGTSHPFCSIPRWFWALLLVKTLTMFKVWCEVGMMGHPPFMNVKIHQIGSSKKTLPDVDCKALRNVFSDEQYSGCCDDREKWHGRKQNSPSLDVFNLSTVEVRSDVRWLDCTAMPSQSRSWRQESQLREATLYNDAQKEIEIRCFSRTDKNVTQSHIKSYRLRTDSRIYIQNGSRTPHPRFLNAALCVEGSSSLLKWVRWWCQTTVIDFGNECKLLCWLVS